MQALTRHPQPSSTRALLPAAGARCARWRWPSLPPNTALSAALKGAAAVRRLVTPLPARRGLSPVPILGEFAVTLLMLAEGQTAGSAGRQDLVIRALTCGSAVLDSGSLAYRLQGPPFAEMPRHCTALHSLIRGLALLNREGGGRAVAALRATTFRPAAVVAALRAAAEVESEAGARKPGGPRA